MPEFERRKIRIREKTRGEVSFARQVLKGVVYLLGIAFLLVLVWYITRLQVFTIQDVIVSGGETISHEDVRIQVMDEFKGTYFLLIPKQFTYLYPHDRMQTVLEKIPRAHNISIGRMSRNTLAISFEEYIPHALWCGEGTEVAQCMFIDDTGYAFTEAPQLQGGSLVRYTVEGLESPSQGSVISSEKLMAIDMFMQRMEQDLGFRVTALLLKKNGDIEFYVNGGGMIFVSESKDLNLTFENLKSVLTSKEFKHLKPGNFQYIDVRFDNKVFVNEELRSSTTTILSSSTTILSE